jgi:hypothetical protein
MADPDGSVNTNYGDIVCPLILKDFCSVLRGDVFCIVFVAMTRRSARSSNQPPSEFTPRRIA